MSSLLRIVPRHWWGWGVEKFSKCRSFTGALRDAALGSRTAFRQVPFNQQIERQFCAFLRGGVFRAKSQSLMPGETIRFALLVAADPSVSYIGSSGAKRVNVLEWACYVT